MVIGDYAATIPVLDWPFHTLFICERYINTYLCNLLLSFQLNVVKFYSVHLIVLSVASENKLEIIPISQAQSPDFYSGNYSLIPENK